MKTENGEGGGEPRDKKEIKDSLGLTSRTRRRKKKKKQKIKRIFKEGLEMRREIREAMKEAATKCAENVSRAVRNAEIINKKWAWDIVKDEAMKSRLEIQNAKEIAERFCEFKYGRK